MKVMIVEDEILVRLGLRKTIPWSTLGLELVCEAKDGAEAYELYKQHLPDIVLVDIEMPKMDGLKFIRFAKTHRTETQFIVLTCHQDMKYAREAIQLQVTDFILKSTLDMNELCDILQHISVQLRQDRKEAEKAMHAPDAAVSLSAQRFMQNWLSGTLDDSGQIRKLLREGAPQHEAGRFQACVLQLGERSQTGPALQSLERLARRQYGERIIGGVADTSRHRWHFIALATLETEAMRRWMQDMADREDIAFSAALSAPFAEPTDWQLHDRKASEALQLQYYDGDSRLYTPDSSLVELMSEPVQKLKKDIHECIGSLQLAAAKRLVFELAEKLGRSPRLHPNIVKNMLTEFLFRIWSVCEELNPGKPAADHRLVDRMYATRSMEQTVALLIEDMERAERQLAMTNSIDDKAKVIVLIKQYIKNHLRQEISLQEIADTFHINSSYLSRLFREVSQMSFTEFVLYEKTELAIVMMKNGKSLTEISEQLGYLNLSSFTRMFKKVRGVSPSHYSDKQEVK